MRLTIQKSYVFVVDTAKERKRINEAFAGTTKKKLLKLMDLVEAQKWKEAEAELDSKWWHGRDEELECSRLEFIGLLNAKGACSWDSYINLIWTMNNYNYPDVYTVTKTTVK